MLANWFKPRAKTPPTNGDARTHLIEMREVTKTFQVGTGAFTALKNITLRVGQGEFVAVIGKSGSGKSTLINMLTGIDRPTSGQVYVGDTGVHALSENEMAIWRGKHLGIIFQFFQLLPMLSLVENVMLPMDFCNVYADRERYDRAMELLKLVGMDDQARKLPTAVSGGQQQRVAIARALANDPPILVADEPTGNLDSRTAASVFELFDRLIAQSKTIVMVTHDTEMAKRVQRAVIVSDGEIIEEYLARNFPSLTREQLVSTTRQLDAEKFPPGALIVREGDPGDKFYLVTRGQAEVVLKGVDQQELVVDTLNPGQYFGEVALVQGGRRIASVRASLTQGAEVVALDRGEFEQFIAHSPEVRAQLERVAQERLANTAATRQET
jgi:ABC-type lipoprotein export system ATPase subunit